MTTGPCVCNQTEHSWLWCPRHRPETTTMTTTTLDAGEAEAYLLEAEGGVYLTCAATGRRLRRVREPDDAPAGLRGEAAGLLAGLEDARRFGADCREEVEHRWRAR